MEPTHIEIREVHGHIFHILSTPSEDHDPPATVTQSRESVSPKPQSVHNRKEPAMLRISKAVKALLLHQSVQAQFCTHQLELALDRLRQMIKNVKTSHEDPALHAILNACTTKEALIRPLAKDATDLLLKISKHLLTLPTPREADHRPTDAASHSQTEAASPQENIDLDSLESGPVKG